MSEKNPIDTFFDPDFDKKIQTIKAKSMMDSMTEMKKTIAKYREESKDNKSWTEWYIEFRGYDKNKPLSAPKDSINYLDIYLTREITRNEDTALRYTLDFLDREQIREPLNILNETIDLIGRQLELIERSKLSEEQTIIQKHIASRILLSIGAARHLLLHGYYNDCATISRQILEYTNLYSFLSQDKSKVQYWFTKPTEFRKEYGPKKIRTTIEGEQKILSQKYDKLCEYVHPNPSKAKNIMVENTHDLYFRSPIFNPNFFMEIAAPTISVMIEFSQYLVYFTGMKLEKIEEGRKFNEELDLIKTKFAKIGDEHPFFKSRKY